MRAMAEPWKSRVLRLVESCAFATWSVVAAAIPHLGWPFVPLIALVIGTIYYTTSADEGMLKGVGFAVVAALAAGLFVALLNNAPTYGPRMVVFAFAAVGLVFGMGAGKLVDSPNLPTLAFFRGRFLGQCVFTGLIVGFIQLPWRTFHDSSSSAADATFGLALLGASYMLPLYVGAWLTNREVRTGSAWSRSGFTTAHQAQKVQFSGLKSAE